MSSTDHTDEWANFSEVGQAGDNRVRTNYVDIARASITHQILKNDGKWPDGYRTFPDGEVVERPAHGELNYYDAENTSDLKRAGLFEEYVNAICKSALVDRERLRFMPINKESKKPIIRGEDEGALERAQDNGHLHTVDETISRLKNGASGYCLYFGRKDCGTENLFGIDIDTRINLKAVTQSLFVQSGSGNGFHVYETHNGSVENCNGSGQFSFVDNIKADNWYLVTPGSVHESGGIYNTTLISMSHHPAVS